MTIALHHPRPQRRKADARNAGVVAGVTAAHLLVFIAVARLEPPPPSVLPPPPIVVELIRPILPPPPPPPPPPAPPSPKAGGGAPAAPSRIHTPPPPERPVPPELPAPKVQAPAPTLVVGVSDKASPTPGFGQGGQGTGTGSGVGAGDGPGAGGTPPRFLRGPTQGQIRDAHPRQALAARRSGVAIINCRIQLDTRLNACRVVSETPSGEGFGQAGLSVAGFYRFQPPTRGGRALDDQGVTVTVEFGPRDAPVG